MSSVDQATATQLANIEKKTGKSLAELAEIARNSGLSKHSEIRDMFKRDFNLGYGDANTLAHAATKMQEKSAATTGAKSIDDVVDGFYSGPKATLRPIHDRIMNELQSIGPFEIAPKKTYLSLRRKKQFAMVGPATNTRVEVGLNMKGVPETKRLTALPAGSMCNYKVKLSNENEVDPELMAWIQEAYEQAG
jgi:hypothetical protein